jgi:peptidoglycan/xylan/chitin deacetylase (PgdA/CDA1 family)
VAARRDGRAAAGRRSRPGADRAVAVTLVALTFDDGPGDVTPAILDLLGEYGARATFFVQGQAIAGREDVLRRIAAEGHEIGNHLYSHPHAARLSEAELRAELIRAGERIEEVLGTPPRLVRPPYGEDAERVSRVAGELGLGPTVLWSVDPRDWEEPPAAEIVRRTLAGLEPGAIVDLHDGFTPWRPDASRQPTVEAIAELLPALSARGYRCVTVSELGGSWLSRRDPGSDAGRPRRRSGS